jgi:hypothetical protein
MMPPTSASFDLPGQIQSQSLDGSSASSSDSLDVQPVCGPAKVPHPTLTARVEKRCQHARCRIVRDFKGQLLLLTREAAQSEVVQHRVTAPAFGDNVVQSESIRKKCFRCATIFASILSTPRHKRVELPKISFAARHQMRDRLARPEDPVRRTGFCVALDPLLCFAAIRASARSTATRYSSSTSRSSSTHSSSVTVPWRHLVNNRSMARPRRRSRSLP